MEAPVRPRPGPWRRRRPAALAAAALAPAAVLLLAYGCLPLALDLPRGPPGPLALRRRTTKLRDPVTGLPRPPPEEADVALDYFQRTFPDVITEEHILIRRWEDLVDVFGGAEAANQLVLEDPTVLRMPRKGARNTFHYLSLYLGPEVAREVVFENPFLLTKKAGQVRKTLPALLNVFGTKQRLAEIAVKYPMLMHIPVGDFYKGVPNMIGVCGNPQAALKVAKEAFDEIRGTPRKSVVPDGYPALVAILGGLEEAKKAVDREPLLLKYQGDQYLGKLLILRELLGRDGAQLVLRKAPYFLHHENQRKVHKFKLAFATLERLFGTEGARKRVLERPQLLTLGVCLQRAVRFAERKLGSREAVRKNFEGVLQRTGLAEHLGWEMKARPRHGYWSPKTGKKMGFPPNPCSWSPHRNPLGRAGPARGRWDEEEPDIPSRHPQEDAEIVPAGAA